MTPLAALDRAKDAYGPGCAEVKLALLRQLERTPLGSARRVARLHELLGFLRAYPDDARVLEQVERMLAGFPRRADLRQHRAALADTGLAGTTVRYRFFWPTARWLAHRWPDRLRLDRHDGDAEEKIGAALPLLAPWMDTVTLREFALPGFGALDRLRGQWETDAAFFLRRIEAMPGDTFTREAFHDAIDATYTLRLGPGPPSRTQAKDWTAPVVFQAGPLRRRRPDLRKELRRPPRGVRVLTLARGRRLVELARQRADPRHRSSAGTLRKLAEWHLFFELDPSRPRELPPTAALGLRVARTLAARTGAGAGHVLRKCEREAMRLCGVRSLAGFTPGERLAWRRWSPLVIALPGVSRWSRADRRALVGVVRAKGGVRESDFVARFIAHPRLGRELLREP
jgi:hypothetical protein